MLFRSLAARAQQPALPVVGFLSSASPNAYADLVAAFRRGLNETGYVEHRNVGIEYRWADDQYDRLPRLAAELARAQVNVIAANSNIAAALAAKAATATIPVVFLTGADPVREGLVASLARPGGNLTGITSLNVELGPKRLELLHELVPAATTLGVLLNPANPLADGVLRDLQSAGRLLGIEVRAVEVSAEREFERAFASLSQQRVGGLVLMADSLFISRSEQIAALALKNAIPVISQFREFATAGGLMSYGASLPDQFRLIGLYTGRILKGEKPSDLPVQQATRVELIINMKTAKALGLIFPITLLGRADEVIE